MGPSVPNAPVYIQRGLVGTTTSPAAPAPYTPSGNSFNSSMQALFDPQWFLNLWHNFLVWVPYLEFLLWILTIGLLATAIWLYIKAEEAKYAWKRALGIVAEPSEPAIAAIEEEKSHAGEGSATWEQVLAHIASSNDSDWRRAVLEADIMLDSMLMSRGYEGDTLADRLKQISPGEYPSVTQAWEAHRIRNAIAHEGDKFPLAQPDAKKVINQYEAVFREFHYI